MHSVLWTMDWSPSYIGRHYNRRQHPVHIKLSKVQLHSYHESRHKVYNKISQVDWELVCSAAT